jgi:hypothetical protein
MDLKGIISREVDRIQSGRYTGKDVDTVVQRFINRPQYRDILRRAIGFEKLTEWDTEPHFRYNILKGVSTPTVELLDDSFIQLKQGAPEKPYSRRECSSQSCLYSQIHVGQRKLLMGEILFLTLYGHRSSTVVYIGAACGQHIPILCDLFPNHTFLLYDPADFAPSVFDYMRKYPGRIAIYNELFPPEDKQGKSYADLIKATSGDNGFLLISDIRRRDETEDHPTNKDVDLDMELQSAICREMQPKAAHLKCRLPYLEPGVDKDFDVTIPKGVIYFQPWAPLKSTETRLVIEPPYTDENTIKLSAKWYESALHYHNLVTRYTRFVFPLIASVDMFLGTVYDGCFDCTFERYILWRYLTSKMCVKDLASLAAIYELIKRVLGREDERLLKP